ncbi:hypothetical protein [Methylocystis parvus]|uniref:hypothetical protein n=1 Tax=Methylocystis parvus TaxID=134 RepID=UPI000371ECB5|nr:hypothetical protein [Methylocystis parvus]WBJ99380.1 hypothetical protein MMG94_15475 [Methylocystis parvus OBBP]
MIPADGLEPLPAFEATFRIFDCDIASDHRNEDFLEEIAKAHDRKIGVVVAQLG